MASYDILEEFSEDPDPDIIDTSPFWVIAVIRYEHPITFDRSKLFTATVGTTISSVGVDADFSKISKERTALIISNDVIQMSISHTKDNYVSNLTANLLPGLNYLAEIQPGDWLMAWIINENKEIDAKTLLENIDQRKPCNGFGDGLKFIGRVQSIRKSLRQAPDGHRMVHYQLNGAGFKELDASIFYDPALAKEEESIGQFLTELGISLADISRDSATSSGGISTTKIIPRIMKLMIGEGIPPASATLGQVQIASGTTATPEAPFSYVIPTSVAKLLGQSNKSKVVHCYADILELLIGLQKYSGGVTPATIFAPQGASTASSNFRTLNDLLLGSFMPLPISFSGKSLWGIMEEFKNPAVNEMYTALRVNAEGRVVPTVVVRQIPFSSQFAIDQGDANQLTAMLELPRWRCHPILVNNMDIGKTDANRLNFIHVYGHPSADGGLSPTEQIVQSPPLRDEWDIKRHGLRPHMQTVACTLEDTLEEPKKWMRILADFAIGHQFTLNGSISIVGVTAPICPGDNFELDETVYHIESVAHTCSISMDGIKQFSTNLQLTHGMRSDTSQTTKPGTSADSIYSGMKAEDNLNYDPGNTDEGSGSKQSDPESFQRTTDNGSQFNDAPTPSEFEV